MLLKNLYRITSENSIDENRFQTSIKIKKANEIFKGHFPNNPILPGVALLEICKQLLEKHLKQKLTLQKASNLKFLAFINPNEDKELSFDFQTALEEKMFNIKILTSFTDGTAVLKCNATFVAIETKVSN